MGDIRKAEEFDALAAKADHAELGLQAQENACALLGIWAVRNRAVISKALRDPGFAASIEAAAKVAEKFGETYLHFYPRPGSPPGKQRLPVSGSIVAAAIRSLPTKDPEQ